MRDKLYFIGFALAFMIVALGLGSDNPNKISGHAISGSLTTRVLVLTSENGTCVTLLNEGWNLVSFYCMEDDLRTATYLAGVNGSVVSMHRYDAAEELDKWKAYNPNLPSWVVQDLGAIDREKGYWLRMSTQKNLTSNGSIIKPTMIHMKKGWNLAGYPTQYPRNVSVSLFNNMAGDWSAVYMYNSSDTVSPWKIYYQSPPMGLSRDFENFTSTFGYWINASKTGDWYVNY